MIQKGNLPPNVSERLHILLVGSMGSQALHRRLSTVPLNLQISISSQSNVLVLTSLVTLGSSRHAIAPYEMLFRDWNAFSSAGTESEAIDPW